MIRFLSTVSLALFLPIIAGAINVQHGETDKGISYLLVESDALPMLGVNVSFRAGSSFEPDGKNGVSRLLATLLDEGAADLSSKAFQEKLEELGTVFGASNDRLNLTVSMKMLHGKEPQSFDLFKDALHAPHLSQEAFQRMKKTVVASLKQGAQKPAVVAGKNFTAAFYENHPYHHMPAGVLQDVDRITVDDVRMYYQEMMTKNNMVVSVVGKIPSRQVLEMWLDHALADLPTGKQHKMTVTPTKPTPHIRRLYMDTPQTAIFTGLPGMTYHDPDYFPALVMNHILGGGGFSARLMTEIREKNGLTYGVYSYFEHLPQGGRWIATMQTKNQDADKALTLLKAEVSKIQQGVSEQELRDAQKYLVGSFPLKLDSNRKILAYLSAIQTENLGADFLETWIENISAVTVDDIKRVSKRLMHPEEMVVVMVGGRAGE